MLKKEIRVALDIIAHFLVTSLLCVWVYSKTQEASFIVMVVIGGILVDIDHFIDYFFYFKGSFRARDFFTCQYLRSGKIYIFLHSWEIVIILTIASNLLHSTHLLVATFSLAVHLAMDNLQRRSPLFYFLAYRYYKSFDARTLYGGEHFLEGI
ncbi:MAG: hypothetical protein KKC84_07945 [Candidatus Omnitrophica bacterium]|nr:hypothetical protein [Candidatus Omnitrophota bacterium]